MEAIIILPAVLITFYCIIELFVHRRERLMLIDKLSQNQSFDLSKLNSFQGSDGIFSGLKIGCLLCGLGLGFLTTFILNIAFQYAIDNSFHLRGTLSIACVLTFGGIGLIVAYLIEKRK
ncbi:MAG: hypothetical protein FWH23_01900 [Bacteroidales bacterium]|nr:hypothetical protein [Bacteroidales bacterium]